jgi:hypothetical protein
MLNVSHKGIGYGSCSVPDVSSCQRGKNTLWPTVGSQNIYILRKDTDNPVFDS